MVEQQPQTTVVAVLFDFFHVLVDLNVNSMADRMPSVQDESPPWGWRELDFVKVSAQGRERGCGCDLATSLLLR